MALPRLVGMVHLGPLPGAPSFAGDLDAVLEAAVADALTLAEAGFDAVVVENFGDAPFFPTGVPLVTVAAMTRAVAEIAVSVRLPTGVNVLRNDALAALSVAAVAEADFIRVNVLSGTMFTDQGPITGPAAELARARKSLAPHVLVLADVFVKHAVPPPGLTIERAAADAWERGGADAIIVSGSGTGDAVDLGRLEAVSVAVPGAPVYAGSGVDEATVAAVLERCYGVIVGTSIKRDGVTTGPVDPERAKRFVEAAG